MLKFNTTLNIIKMCHNTYIKTVSTEQQKKEKCVLEWSFSKNKLILRKKYDSDIHDLT